MLILRIFHKHDIKFEGEGYDEKYPDDRDIHMALARDYLEPIICRFIKNNHIEE